MTDRRDSENYTALFLEFSDAVEHWLRRALILLIIGTCLFQMMLRIPVLRHFLSSAERFEGVSIYKQNRPQ